jgi:poly(hydroxyalkanoate) granule-associated protein
MAKTRKEIVTEQAEGIRDDLKRLGRKSWLAGLGAFAVVREEAEGLFDRLVTKGEEVETDEENVLRKTWDRAAERGAKMRETVEQRMQGVVSAVLHRAGVPDREEIHTLIDRVERLTEKVQTMGAAR